MLYVQGASFSTAITNRCQQAFNNFPAISLMSYTRPTPTNLNIQPILQIVSVEVDLNSLTIEAKLLNTDGFIVSGLELAATAVVPNSKQLFLGLNGDNQ